MKFLKAAVAVIIFTAGLAGCLDSTEGPLDPDTDGIKGTFVPGPGSHPAYGYPTAADLPVKGEPGPGLPDDWRKPIPLDLPDPISSFSHLGQVAGVESGAGIAIFGPYVYVGAYDSDSFWVVELDDITQPKLRGFTEAKAGDADVIAYPDGRLVVVTATRGQSMLVVDVTDPDAPELISVIDTVHGNHNLAIVPGTPIVYNTGSSGDDGSVEIYDLSDPLAPVLANDWLEGASCHAASFYINADEGRYRGYCAGIETTEIWDVTDPLNPTIISRVPFPTGGVDSGVGGVAPASFSHLAMPNHDGTVMIVGDETGGGAAPGCDAYQNVAGVTVTGPLGNLFFYDITDEANPVLRGSISPGAESQRGSCTAHFGGIVEDQALVVMAFYSSGIVLVNFDDLDNPRIVDTWGRTENDQICTLCGVWDAQYYQGAVISGDVDRGMDVLGFL